MAARSTLEGGAQLSRQLAELGKLGPAMRLAVRSGMKEAYKVAQAKIPVGKAPHRTAKTYGRLLVLPGYSRSALRIITLLNGAKNRADALMSVRKPAFYAVAFVDHGTVHMAARKWLVPAFVGARERMESAIIASLSRTIERAARTT